MYEGRPDYKKKGIRKKILKKKKKEGHERQDLKNKV